MKGYVRASAFWCCAFLDLSQEDIKQRFLDFYFGMILFILRIYLALFFTLQLPGMLVFDRAGEVTVTVAECSSSPVFPSSEQLSLIQRFTEYIFRDIAKPGNASEKPFPKFDPTIASSGYYIVLLKDVNDDSSAVPNEVKHKEIACDFMQSIENALGSFDNPTDPPPAGIQNMEIFIDAVVTAVYNDKRPRYYVADICYDRSPADPFPNSEAAATFAEYYQIRYGSEVKCDLNLM